ncbi:hypothetical protein [Mastigocoleus testarum]|uniref:Uncharacterized protein n=1 Tax=Mastigocoleus testarum BC008 TaxID=371196 RepID=A0A0V7ZV17_9CYAN|nr:hypothetical protein [Mastigocoleus testarum]KST64560.1 hypothetical protein BC008_18195 [Mastigocoleus testarum BC008]KST68464.1 hypothetical protein BC008_00920 [Mastigocoleus testarum BC008]
MKPHLDNKPEIRRKLVQTEMLNWLGRNAPSTAEALMRRLWSICEEIGHLKAEEEKGFNLVEAEPGRPAKVEFISIPC